MFVPTVADVQKFQEEGYLMVPALFDQDEVSLLLATASEDKRLMDHAQAMDDGAGGKSNLSVWCIAGDDLYGMFARSQRIVDTAEGNRPSLVYRRLAVRSIGVRAARNGEWMALIEY